MSSHARPRSHSHRGRRIWLVGLGVVALTVLAMLVWFGLSARSAYGDLTASRDDLQAARDAVATTDLAAAQESFDSAAEHASAAADAVNGPMWSLATAIPGLGDTPEAVQAVATSLDQALIALSPAVDRLGDLDPQTVVGEGGSIDVVALQDAAEPMENARQGLDAAAQTLAEAPSSADGDRVLGRVDEAAAELATQLAELDGTLENAVEVARLAPPLLGVDGPKRYFVALLNPNEARGTGGFLGTYAIIQADGGTMTVERIGSNTDLVDVPYTPPELGAQFIKRYSDGPRLTENLNISPHFPAAGLLWLKSWEEKTGDQVDGAISADVVALGDLLTATGQEVTLPDGTSMNGAELTDFALKGIYEQFPTGENSPERKAYQEAVTQGALDSITAATNPGALLPAFGQALTERRIQVWSADPEVQQQVLDAGIGGTLETPDGHNVTSVVINSAASKLDAFLERSLTYEVGRCVSPNPGRVVSTVEVGLTSAIPEGADIPDYMISGARRGPDGPINSTILQLYLPNGAEILEVAIDGKDSQYSNFREQGRVAVLLPLTLPPRQERTVTVRFSEPADDGPGTAPEQPLADDQVTTITDEVCS